MMVGVYIALHESPIENVKVKPPIGGSTHNSLLPRVVPQFYDR